MSQIRVLIADDSATVRGILKRIFSQDSQFLVCGLAENGQRAIELLNETNPDLVILDIEMPILDGISALPLLLKARPGVRVIMASSFTKKGSAATVQALALGAVDYIAKPSATSFGASMAELSSELINKARAIKYPTQVKSEVLIQKQTVVVNNELSKTIMSVPQIIVIGCSTGGPNALISVLKNLDLQNLHMPILVVQHMSDYFIRILAERVTKEIGRHCKVIESNDCIVDDYIGIAPGDFHVELHKDSMRVVAKLNQKPPENFCRPAVDPLFRTASEVYGNSVLAVILTGMGEDGRRGCASIHKNGGFIIAQDEATSVVWGMPGAVVKDGIANVILPLDEIAQFINHTKKGFRQIA